MPSFVMTIGTIMYMNSIIKQCVGFGTKLKCSLCIYSIGNAWKVRSYCEVFISVWFICSNVSDFLRH